MSEEAVVVEPAGEKTISVNALLVEGALVVDRADGKADVISAGVAGIAVIAAAARDRQSDALDLRVSGESWWTAAALRVTGDLATEISGHKKYSY